MTDPASIPFVDYLALEPEPHLVANECTACGARFFSARTACANCFAQEFRAVDLPTEGEVVSFSIVTFAPPGVETPFVAAQVDLGGTQAAGNIVGTPTDPEHVSLGMKVRLTTFSVGTDDAGTEAFNYGFTPAN